MHPEYEKERRQARIQALKRILERTNNKAENVRYTDAAAYRTNDRFAISVVNESSEELTATSIRAKDVSTVEELGIALSIATCKKTLVTVVMDSQEACRRYGNRRIGNAALKVLKNTEIEAAHILWTPGHESLAGNQAAHVAARDHARRAISDTQRTQTDCDDDDELISKKYSDILAHYRKQTRRYTPAYKTMSREQAVTSRRIQARTYPHGTLLHAMYPGTYGRDCKFCPPDTPNTLIHMVLRCRNNRVTTTRR